MRRSVGLTEARAASRYCELRNTGLVTNATNTQADVATPRQNTHTHRLHWLVLHSHVTPSLTGTLPVIFFI